MAAASGAAASSAAAGSVATWAAAVGSNGREGMAGGATPLKDIVLGSVCASTWLGKRGNQKSPGALKFGDVISGEFQPGPFNFETVLGTFPSSLHYLPAASEL